MVQSVQHIGDIQPSFIDAIKKSVSELTSQQGSLCQIEKRCQDLMQSAITAFRSQTGQMQGDSIFSDFSRLIKNNALPDSLKASLLEVQDLFERVHAGLEGKARRVDLEKKWMSLGLPVEVLEGPWNCVEALFSSGAAFAMSAYLKLCHGRSNVRMNQETKEVELLFEGAYMPWNIFQDRYVWSKKRDAFIGKLDEAEELSLTSFPKGFIRKSRFTYDEPFPTAILDTEQLRSIQRQASLFNGSSELPHAVVQVFTSPGGFSGPDWLCKAFAETGNVPSHCGIRVISNTGEVYTFGYMMDPKEETTWASPFRLASTVKASIGMIDYDEFRKFGKRYVTSLPLSEDSFKRVMASLKERQRANESVFNFGRDNCAEFSASVLRDAGYELPDLHVSVTRFFGGLIVAPIMHMPVVGKVIRTVARVFAYLFSGMQKVGGGVLSLSFFKPVVEPLNYVGDKVMAAVKWFFSYLMGATKISPYVTRVVGDRAKPFLSIHDIFRVGATDMVSSEGLLEWMQHQRSTKEYEYKGPELTIL